MKITLNWLRQYVDFNWTPEELTERLTMLGLEVEGVQKLGGEFEGIVVAQVLQKDRHPNADKLWLCRVADGQGERQIVCGAQNFNVGDKVPLILPGIIAGGMLSFVTAINELSSSLVLYVGSTATMPVRIYIAINDGDYGTAAALSTVLLVLSGTAIYTAFRLMGRDERALL